MPLVLYFAITLFTTWHTSSSFLRSGYQFPFRKSNGLTAHKRGFGLKLMKVPLIDQKKTQVEIMQGKQMNWLRYPELGITVVLQITSQQLPQTRKHWHASFVLSGTSLNIQSTSILLLPSLIWFVQSCNPLLTSLKFRRLLYCWFHP